MRSELEMDKLISQCNSEGRTKTFAEFIAVLFKDKYIEIYLGDSFEEIKTEQISMSYPAVFCGKVLGAYKECIIINSFFKNKDKSLQQGNIVFINERAVRALREIDDFGSVNDLFIKSGTESSSIKHFGK